jgi:hypothetical protein
MAVVHFSCATGLPLVKTSTKNGNRRNGDASYG